MRQLSHTSAITPCHSMKISRYPLVNVYKQLWNIHPFWWVNQLFLWPFSRSQTVSLPEDKMFLWFSSGFVWGPRLVALMINEFWGARILELLNHRGWASICGEILNLLETSEMNRFYKKKTHHTHIKVCLKMNYWTMYIFQMVESRKSWLTNAFSGTKF